MTGHLVQPWGFRSRAAGAGLLVANYAINPTFTELGHLSAFLVGVMTGGVESRWSTWRQRRRG
ncbi:hypothetical protein [Mycolicibacterium sp.]|uniref:hypothetical protein n=1 Tax=Mycolicibacterium sp. TaxID=2320850 RepID=UPI001A18D514|nr:hypothetical protein [Mycolicibacterium sp.]MBJ7337023.1 hypothetical protein [Mycolicibacterium sp.]